MSEVLGNSTEEQALLRPIALWAAGFAEKALPIFENTYPDDVRPRDAVDAAREFGQGKKRDKNLRMVAFAAMKSGKEVSEPCKHAVQSAVLTAAVAYTHTDLQTGLQGVRQARHILGSVVHAALAMELAANDQSVSDDILQRAAETAPPEVAKILQHLPHQPVKKQRIDILFAALDAALRK
jgi:hypothetical protein